MTESEFVEVVKVCNAKVEGKGEDERAELRRGSEGGEGDEVDGGEEGAEKKFLSYWTLG